METKDSEGAGKVIGNVGVLDLRRATEASIAEISRIGNVGTMLYSPETAILVTRLNVGNVGSTTEVSADAKMITGEVVFNSEYFKGQEAQLDLVVTGQLVVYPDVPAEDIEQGLGELHVVGQLVCPEHLAGILQSKTKNLVGQSIIYASSGQLIVGRLVLDENYLHSLEDDSELVVIGSLRLPHVLPNDLLEQKIQNIQVSGTVRCHEANVRAILARMVDKSAKITTIPAGFELVDSPLVLNSALLESLPAKHLYCIDRVQIDPEVDSPVLDERLEVLISEDVVICPVKLRSVLARKCNLLETQAIFYEGELWLVDAEFDLTASRFDYLEGKATLVVLGELTIDPEIDPKVLVDRLAKVHNFGEIRCTSKQLGAIQARLGVSDGELQDTTRADTADEGVGNVGYLAI